MIRLIVLRKILNIVNVFNNLAKQFSWCFAELFQTWIKLPRKFCIEIASRHFQDENKTKISKNLMHISFRISTFRSFAVFILYLFFQCGFIGLNVLVLISSVRNNFLSNNSKSYEINHRRCKNVEFHGLRCCFVNLRSQNMFVNIVVFLNFKMSNRVGKRLTLILKNLKVSKAAF